MSMPTNPARPTYIVVKMRACDLQPGDVIRWGEGWVRIDELRVNDYGEIEFAEGQNSWWETVDVYTLVDVQERVPRTEVGM